MLKHDKARRFQFATAQSARGQALYRSMGLQTDEFETNLVIVDGRAFQRMNAFATAMGTLLWPWRWLAVLRRFPDFLKDTGYHWIARNRYRVLGRFQTCPVQCNGFIWGPDQGAGQR